MAVGEASAPDVALPPPGAREVALPRPDGDSARQDSGVSLEFDKSPLPSRSKR